MNLILNLLWLICGGLFAGFAWYVVGLLFALSVVGLPWARAAFNIGAFTLWPFGRTAIERTELTGTRDFGTGAAGALGNVVWLLAAGWWLAFGHIAAAIMLTCSIIGIPFAWQHVKLAILAFWPIGMSIVPNDVATMAQRGVPWQRMPAYRR